MLLDLRETVRNSKPIKYTLITIICIPFVLFGIGSYFSGGGASYAAKVDGEEISVREFEQAYSQQRRRMAQMFGGQIPDGFADESILREQALDGLLTSQVMRNTVRDNGFAVSNKTLASAIAERPEFQTDGVFDQERYFMLLRSSGTSADAFENSFREDAALGQFRAGIVDTSFVLPTEQKALDELTRQVRKIDTVTFAMAPLKEETEVEDAEVQAYFDENAETFMFPQRVKIQYLSLDAAAIADDIDVSDEEAAAYFEENKSSYLVPEERKASHILLSLDEDASDNDVDEASQKLLDIKSRVESGEDFAALAKEFSDDVGTAEQGGSLGAIAPGAMVPEFEEAVFALSESGSLSEPVRTQFGIHLVRLDEIVPEKGETFEQAKEKVIASFKQETAQRDYQDLYDILIEQSFDNPDALDSAADATGLEIQESDWIDGTPDTAPELSNPIILTTALTDDVLNGGLNSEVIDLGPQSVMVLRTLEHEDPRPQTLDDVRDQVVDTVKTNKAAEVLDAALAAAGEGYSPGADLQALADDNNGELTTDLEIGRQSTDLDREAIQKLFSLAKPAPDAPVVESLTLGNGDRMMMVLKEISVEAEDEEAEQEFVAANPRLGNAEFSLMLEHLRAGSKIETNEELMNYYQTQ